MCVCNPNSTFLHRQLRTSKRQPGTVVQPTPFLAGHLPSSQERHRLRASHRAPCRRAEGKAQAAAGRDRREGALATRAREAACARVCVCEGQSAPGSIVIMEKERAAGAGGGGSRVIVAPRRGVLPPAAVALRDLRNAHNASSSAGVSSAGVRVRMCAGVPGAWTRDAIVSSCLPPWRL